VTVRTCASGAVLVAALVAACGDVLPAPDLERMIAQRGLRPFEETPFFADRRAMRTPPAGTIPRDAVVGRPELAEGVTAGGADVAAIPIAVDRALLERGRGRFEIFCATCHGLTGDGVSAVAHNMALRRPPPIIAPPVTEFPPGRIFRVISGGYGLMPGYATVLDVRDRWATVAYLRALTLSQAARLDQLPAPLRAEAREALR
jgi:mono/diheme cytochrome c family protein